MSSPSVLYAEQPEWADVIPIPQYENVEPLAPILYTPEYKDATDYFRGIVKTGEKSQRVLSLTEHIIRLNPAHYSAWQYRYETLLAIKAPLDVELKLMDEIAIKHMKTYQVWHHRRLLMTHLLRNTDSTGIDKGSSSSSTQSPTQIASSELTLIARTLAEDSKNYHTWSYRQWLLAFFNDDSLWERELDFVDSMLNADVRNNSAWHHRFFVVFQSGVREGEQNRDRVLKRELIYVKQNISLAPNNASAWNYLRGVLDLNKLPYSNLVTFVQPYSVSHPDTPSDLVDLENPPPSRGAQLPCPAAIEFLADVYEKEGGDNVLKATELWKSLGSEHDTIRKRYWEFRVKEGLRAIQAQS
ncbi:protein prenylyltransferase [Dendrothele bispora CBS 962.96]|uniref:Protein farnesyltransferase/geranylgeranyltransferase type-1 subunit alpha n=1 Tax=Dendrothele bispora (strain CBS 962.96) TaxID=1314807 RepID=A0A4V4HH93_DENBC|nr:protein prenylyltransferase [Dendrothele bispora CBS 962.96]